MISMFTFVVVGIFVPNKTNNHNGSQAQAFENAAFAFRGYNVTNLGRTPELLAHPAYGPVVERYLCDASGLFTEIMGRRADLVDRVRRKEDTTLATYSEAVAMTVAVELAQIELLRQFFGFDFSRARIAYGYSLGEVAALAACGVFGMKEALKVPLLMSEDCAALAEGTTLGVLFSRGPAIDELTVRRMCLEISAEGKGTIGVSSYLAPNSLLLIGQGPTLDRFAELVPERFTSRLYLRKNEHVWPPLHTPIMWQRAIPNRAAVLMESLPIKTGSPIPPVFSLVTGNISYDELNCRRLLVDWVDHPQLLWDAVYETLLLDVKTVVHVGQEPNLFPATFRRLSENVQAQTAANTWGARGLRFVSRAARRPWLAKLLPERSALLRAPYVKQVNLEDWLLATKPTH
jgi:[acyl-carrier-protein] S-malonyltransferase